jgi:hypothetical protein
VRDLRADAERGQRIFEQRRAARVVELLRLRRIEQREIGQPVGARAAADGLLERESGDPDDDAEPDEQQQHERAGRTDERFEPVTQRRADNAAVTAPARIDDQKEQQRRAAELRDQARHVDLEKDDRARAAPRPRARARPPRRRRSSRSCASARPSAPERSGAATARPK